MLESKLSTAATAFEREATASNIRKYKSMLHRFNDQHDSKIAELEALRSTELEAARVIRQASEVLTDSRTFLIHDHMTDENAPQAHWKIFNELVWEAFETCESATQAEAISTDLKDTLLSKLLKTRSLYLQLDGLVFSQPKQPGSNIFALFSKDQLYLENVTLGKIPRIKYLPSAKRTIPEHVALENLNRQLSQPDSFTPRPQQPICKVWNALSGASSHPNAPLRLDGLYVSEQSQTASAGLISFSRVEVRQADGIIKEFTLSCGFAQNAVTGPDGQSPESSRLKIDVSLGQVLSSADEFTLGHFLEVFDPHADKWEVRQ